MRKASSISKAQTFEEIADFWDSYSLADFWDQTHEVEFEVREKRRRRITLTPEVYQQIEAQVVRKGFYRRLWLIFG